jgi:glycosyltransferase involved in cell wall biosynthesis
VKLVHVADYGGPYPGSFVHMLRSVLLAARARGWDVEAVFGPAARDRCWLSILTDAEIPVRFAAPRPRNQARANLAPLLADEREPLLVHTHFTGFDIPAAQVVGRRPAAALIWHNHMGASSRPGTVARNVVKYLTYGRRVDRILCVAPEAVTAAKRRGAPRRRTLYFPNAIDTSRFALVSREERRAARTALGVAADTPLLLHFGWDWERKGGDLLLRATERLRRAGMPAVAATVGGGEFARELAAELRIEDAVLALEPRDDVRGLLAAADVFVSCSRAEGTTYAVAEALCCGVPVVASRIPGQEWIARGEPARVLTALNADEVASGVRRLLERPPDVAAEESAGARRWVLEHMDIERWSERLLDVYDELLPGASETTASRSGSRRSAT